MPVKENPQLGFGSAQVATFAPLLPIIEEVASLHDLQVSRVFDGYDPITPHCCYFLEWSSVICRGCYIRICAQELFTISKNFHIGANGRSSKNYQQWDYSIDEGQERLREILRDALLVMELL